MTRGYDARRDQVSGWKMVIQDRTEKRYLVYRLLFTFREFRDGPLNFYLICSQQKKVRKRNWAAVRSLSLFFFLLNHLKKGNIRSKEKSSYISMGTRRESKLTPPCNTEFPAPTHFSFLYKRCVVYRVDRKDSSHSLSFYLLAFFIAFCLFSSSPTDHHGITQSLQHSFQIQTSSIYILDINKACSFFLFLFTGYNLRLCAPRSDHQHWWAIA